jgi:hypothetical protein
MELPEPLEPELPAVLLVVLLELPATDEDTTDVLPGALVPAELDPKDDDDDTDALLDRTLADEDPTLVELAARLLDVPALLDPRLVDPPTLVDPVPLDAPTLVDPVLLDPAALEPGLLLGNALEDPAALVLVLAPPEPDPAELAPALLDATAELAPPPEDAVPPGAGGPTWRPLSSM